MRVIIQPVPNKSALKRLFQRRKAILINRIADEAHLPVSDHPADFLCQATLGNIQDMSLALRDKQLEALKNIDLAIERAKKGEYGICIECDEAIPRKRLEVSPEVSLCLACKEEEEAVEKRIIPEPCPLVEMGMDFSVGSMMKLNVAL